MNMDTSGHMQELVSSIGADKAGVSLAPGNAESGTLDSEASACLVESTHPNKEGQSSSPNEDEEQDQPQDEEAVNKPTEEMEAKPPQKDEDESSEQEADKSHDRLLKWWKLTHQRSRYTDLAENVVKVREYDKATEFELWPTLRRILDDIDDQLDLRALLAEESTDVKSSVGKRTSNFQVGLLPWRELRQDVPDDHAAIDVPLAEPDQSDLSEHSEAPGKPRGEARLRTLDSSQNLLSVVGELPERIRISSGRLQRFLEHVCKANFGWNVDEPNLPIHLLRPFKLLIIFQVEIRSRVQEIEDTRRQLADLSEDQYLAEFEKAPSYDDEDARTWKDTSNLSLSELTGLINDCRCLLRFMDELLLPEHTRISQGPDDVRFEDLWHLFQIGSLAYSRDEMIPQRIWRVLQVSGGRRLYSHGRYMRREDEFVNTYTDFRLQCIYIDYDGTRHVQVSHTFSFPRFEGRRALSALSMVPLFTAERTEGLIDKGSRLSHGRQFLECRIAKHLYYSGRTLDRTPDGRKLSYDSFENEKDSRRHHQESERVESEVVVDFARACQSTPRWRPGYLPEWEMRMTKESDKEIDADPAEWGDGSYEKERNWLTDVDSRWDQRLRMAYSKKEEHERRRYEAPISEAQGKQGALYTPPDDEFLLLLPDRVYAFVLRTRRWACLRLSKGLDEGEGLTKRKSRPDPWNDLKLPDGHKEIVKSLIESHFSPDPVMRTQFDLVREKGNGVIILLHGVPGVGKTSTAECVAESNGRPLLPITCGDLGLSPESVENRLQEIFRLAHAWGCILLLDEADVFLAQRSLSDMKRNSLVSVFLRTLEYYEGVLFLTTNRVGVFDEAFKSRIHMSLYYPSLNQTQTYQIWQSHAVKAIEAGFDVNTDELTSFAGVIYRMQQQPNLGPVWNGRQIRNAFRSAIALAGFHAKNEETIKLEKKYFEKVLEVANSFSNYITRVNMGQTDSDVAKMRNLRRDDFVDGSGYHGLATPLTPSPASQSVFGRGSQNAATIASWSPPYQQQQVSMASNNNFANMPTSPFPQYSQASQTGHQYQDFSPHQIPNAATGYGQVTMQHNPRPQQHVHQQQSALQAQQDPSQMGNHGSMPRTTQPLTGQQMPTQTGFVPQQQASSQQSSMPMDNFVRERERDPTNLPQVAKNLAQQISTGTQAALPPQQIAMMGNMQQQRQQQQQQPPGHFLS